MVTKFKCTILLFLFSLISISVLKAQKKTDSLDACWIVKNPLNTKIIQKNAKVITSKGKDNCVLAMIDRITDSTFTKNYKDYFKTLASIQLSSDGYVSEYLDEVGAKIFHKNFHRLFLYIYKPNSNLNSPIEKITIESVGLEISDSKNKTIAKNNIESFLKKQRLEMSLNSDQINYLNILKKSIFDYSEK